MPYTHSSLGIPRLASRAILGFHKLLIVVVGTIRLPSVMRKVTKALHTPHSLTLRNIDKCQFMWYIYL